jgi:hypothetical protein
VKIGILLCSLFLIGCNRVQRISPTHPEIADLCGDERIYNALVFAIAHATNQDDVLPVFAAQMNKDTIRWLALNHSATQLEDMLANKKRGKALHHYTEGQLKAALGMQGMKPRRIRKLLENGE